MLQALGRWPSVGSALLVAGIGVACVFAGWQEWGWLALAVVTCLGWIFLLRIAEGAVENAVRHEQLQKMVELLARRRDQLAKVEVPARRPTD